MKNLNLFYLAAFLILILTQGCFTPINMAYDNASPLEKNQFVINGAYAQSSNNASYDNSNSSSNDLKIGMGLGLSENASMYANYYQKSTSIRSNAGIIEQITDEINNYTYIDGGFKFALNKKKNLANKSMIGVYLIDGDAPVSVLYTSFIYSPINREKFDVSFVGNLTYFWGVSFVPGINFNCGIKLGKTGLVLRPELGITSYSASTGIGLQYHFPGKGR